MNRRKFMSLLAGMVPAAIATKVSSKPETQTMEVKVKFSVWNDDKNEWNETTYVYDPPEDLK